MTRPVLIYLFLLAVIFGLVLYAMILASQIGPSARVQLSAIPDDGAVELYWTSGDASPPINGWEYRYRLSDGSFGAWAGMPGRPNANRRYDVTDLLNGHVYVFQVRPSGEGHEDEWSNLLSVVPVAASPIIRPRWEPCAGIDLREVRFHFNSYQIDLDYRDNRRALETILQHLLVRGTAGRALVTGYASSKGKASYNLDLSEQRAASVIEHLREKVDAQFSALPMGEGREAFVPDRTHERHQRVIVRSCEDVAAN